MPKAKAVWTCEKCQSDYEDKDEAMLCENRHILIELVEEQVTAFFEEILPVNGLAMLGIHSSFIKHLEILRGRVIAPMKCRTFTLQMEVRVKGHEAQWVNWNERFAVGPSIEGLWQFLRGFRDSKETFVYYDESEKEWYGLQLIPA